MSGRGDGEAFGRRGLLRRAADTLVRGFAGVAGVPEAAEHLGAATPASAGVAAADPGRIIRCNGIWCHMVSCTGCACGGHLFRCTGCGRDYVACIEGRGCWSFCLRRSC